MLDMQDPHVEEGDKSFIEGTEGRLPKLLDTSRSSSASKSLSVFRGNEQEGVRSRLVDIFCYELLWAPIISASVEMARSNFMVNEDPNCGLLTIGR